MTFGTTAAVIGAATSLYGAYEGHQNSRRAQNAQDRALSNMSSFVNPFRAFSGPNDPSAQYSNPGSVRFNYGDMTGLFQGAGGYASRAMPMMPSTGLPSDIASSMRLMEQRSGGPAGMFNGLDALERRGSAFGDASYQDMLANLRGGFQRPLQNNAFRGASTQLEDAMMGGENARNRQLDLLRQQAAPFEQRAMDSLQNNLFSTGRMGSSGGGLQMEAFGRGLGQADLDRQLSASQEGRNFQQNALGLSTGAANIGMGLSRQEQDMLQMAFGRFRDTQGMNADLNRERFSRSMYGNELGYNRSRDILGTRVNLAGLPMSLDAARIGNAGSALGLRGSLQNEVLQMFNAGLGAEQAAANARIGSGSNIASIVGSPSYGRGGMEQASMWSQLGRSMMGDQSLTDIMGRMFAGGSQVQPPDAWGALDESLRRGFGG